jgi:hypothetical protein
VPPMAHIEIDRSFVRLILSRNNGAQPNAHKGQHQEAKVKADREVARAAKKHTVEFTAPRGSDDDEECRSSTPRGWRR